MRAIPIADCLLRKATHRDLSENLLALLRAGSAVRWLRMAASAIEEQNEEQNVDVLTADDTVVQYHAYVGVSAPRTAIDATSVWLQIVLDLPPERSRMATDLGKDRFFNKVVKAFPEGESAARLLKDLAVSIDDLLQEAQHRGAVSQLRASIRFNETGRWYFRPIDVTRLQTAEGRAQFDMAHTFRIWADTIEKALCELAELADQRGLLGYRSE